MRELTPEVAAALERMRDPVQPLSITADQMEQRRRAAFILAYVMLDIYPPGHADPITPERLVACGFSPYGPDLRAPCPSRLTYCQHMNPPRWFCEFQIHSQIAPRSMGEVWQLLDRLGIDWRTKGGE